MGDPPPNLLKLLVAISLLTKTLKVPNFQIGMNESHENDAHELGFGFCLTTITDARRGKETHGQILKSQSCLHNCSFISQ